MLRPARHANDSSGGGAYQSYNAVPQYHLAPRAPRVDLTTCRQWFHLSLSCSGAAPSLAQGAFDGDRIGAACELGPSELGSTGPCVGSESTCNPTFVLTLGRTLPLESAFGTKRICVLTSSVRPERSFVNSSASDARSRKSRISRATTRATSFRPSSSWETSSWIASFGSFTSARICRRLSGPSEIFSPPTSTSFFTRSGKILSRRLRSRSSRSRGGEGSLGTLSSLTPR